MGINIGPEIKYKCSNDCSQTGCPGHTMRMDDCRSSDVISFVIDGKPIIYLDENKWKAMRDAERAHAKKFGWNRNDPKSVLSEEL
jgi:hypothetical protein